MSTSRSVSPELEKEIISSLPDLNYFIGEVRKRTMYYLWVPEGKEHLALSWVCLIDASELIQTAIAALKNAKRDWISADNHYEEDENKLVLSVSDTRYNFDYAVLLMTASSNHLAAAMWHFHEKSG